MCDALLFLLVFSCNNTSKILSSWILFPSCHLSPMFATDSLARLQVPLFLVIFHTLICTWAEIDAVLCDRCASRLPHEPYGQGSHQGLGGVDLMNPRATASASDQKKNDPTWLQHSKQMVKLFCGGRCHLLPSLMLGTLAYSELWHYTNDEHLLAIGQSGLASLICSAGT